MRQSLFTFLPALALTGCATLFQGTHQGVTLVATGHRQIDATCRLTNEEGSYTGALDTTVSVHRDGEPLTVVCEGEGHQGMVSVQPNFEGQYLVLDLLLDYCIISCIVDGVNNAFYSYPPTVFVPMRATLQEGTPSAPVVK